MLLSGEKCSAVIRPWPTCRLRSASPLATFQRISCPPWSLVEATCAPSGLNASESTRKPWARNSLRCAPLATSHSRTVPSKLPEASVLPSGEKARPRLTTMPVWPRSVRGSMPVAASTSTIEPSSEPTASVLPSGENDRPVVQSGAPVFRFGAGSKAKPSRLAPEATSHICTVPSEALLASERPSGENATVLIKPSWPCNVRSSWPVAGSHSLMLVSKLPEARVLPSGENATIRIQPLCPLSTRSCWPVAASHTRTVFSSIAPEASSLLSGA